MARIHSAAGDRVRGLAERAPVPGAASLDHGGRSGRRALSEDGWASSCSRTTACCSSTSSPSSPARRSRRCASRSRTDGSRIVRARRSAVHPARFMLIAATNPCPCGYAGEGSAARAAKPTRAPPPPSERTAARPPRPARAHAARAGSRATVRRRCRSRARARARGVARPASARRRGCGGDGASTRTWTRARCAHVRLDGAARADAARGGRARPAQRAGPDSACCAWRARSPIWIRARG